MKLKKGFITHNSDGEQILVATGNAQFSGIVRSNDTAAFIVECLKKETTEKEIIKKMTEKYDASDKVISADVKKIIRTLRSIGAIDE
jgi:hypothetical protein rflaF_17579